MFIFAHVNITVTVGIFLKISQSLLGIERKVIIHVLRNLISDVSEVSSAMFK